MPGDYGEIKVVTATMPSGAGTSNGVSLGGFRAIALYIPVLTNAVVSWISPTAAGSTTYSDWRNAAANRYTASSLGGTGNMWLRSTDLDFLVGYAGEVRVSAAAVQTAAAQRDFVWHLKG